MKFNKLIYEISILSYILSWISAEFSMEKIRNRFQKSGKKSGEVQKPPGFFENPDAFLGPPGFFPEKNPENVSFGMKTAGF